MINYIANIIFKLGITLIIIVLILSSSKVIYANLKYFNMIKSGEIIAIEYSEGSRADNQRGTFINTIILSKLNDTIYAGSQDQLHVGDLVKFRYIGARGGIIFEVNNKKIGSKYDLWDWLSPVLLLSLSIILYKIITHWFLPSFKTIKK